MARPSNKEGRMKRPGFSGPKMNDGNDDRRQNGRNGKHRPRQHGKPDDKPTNAPRPGNKQTGAPHPDNKRTDARENKSTYVLSPDHTIKQQINRNNDKFQIFRHKYYISKFNLIHFWTFIEKLKMNMSSLCTKLK